LFSRYLCVALCVAKQRKQRSVIFKITEPEHYVFWGKNLIFLNPLPCKATEATEQSNGSNVKKKINC